MCNRLGKRKFLERYKESRAGIAKRMAFEKDRHGRPLYNNYLPNILTAHGNADDRLYCPYNGHSSAERRLARLFALERLDRIWLMAYGGPKRPKVIRRKFYAQVLARRQQDKADTALMFTANRMQQSFDAASKAAA